MKKDKVLKSKNIKKITTIVTVLIFTLTIISSNSISIQLRKEPVSNNLKLIEKEEILSEVLLQNRNFVINENLEFKEKVQKLIYEDCPIAYGYNAYPGPEAIVKIDICNCTIEECGDTISGDFLTGGTVGCNGVFYSCQYGNGLLYGIDPETCDMWSIGGGGIGINGLAYNPKNDMLYGSSDSNYLILIDPETGEQEQIGPFGGGVLYMVGMAFNADGDLYGWDLGNDALWKIDFETGEVTKVCELGIGINYAVDGDFHRESGILYLAAYSGLGGLYAIDVNTCEGALICDSWGIEVSAFAFVNPCTLPEHDLSLVSIDYPESGYAIADIPMQVTIKNMGNNTETTDVQMQVIKYETGPVIFEEDFSGTFPPEGWDTDYWKISYTNEAGGISPEARVNKYDQYNEGDYYDNYIKSAPIDCSNLDRVNLKFRWAADYYYPQYCSVYIKYRGNSTSPWKDITPWDNPINQNQNAQLLNISCYSFEKPLGDEFQIKWEYLGYYQYYNNISLDDVETVKQIQSLDYNETVEDIEIEKGEELIVEFPTWTPAHWQDPDYEDTYEEYRIRGCVLLEDEKPNNNYENKIIKLHYPWLHDIEVKRIDSPCEDGPGKTYSVKTTIKNIGQNTECCIPIEVRIGNPFVVDTLFTEYDWPGSTYYPGQTSGWKDEHDSIDYYYGWQRYYNSYAGGEPYEAYLPYYYAKQDYVFYSQVIDASTYQLLRLRFLSYINHFSGQGLYSLEAGYSFDADTWYTAWSEEPSSSGGYEVEVPIEGGSDTLYIGFWVKGNPYYFNYWYIDNVELVCMDYTEEYYDFACQGPDIEPGEEITFTMEDWTPARLAEMTSGSEDYIIEATIEMAGDKNPSNDIKREEFTLDYWWDAGVDEITSPTGDQGDRLDLDELYYDNGDPDGSYGLFFGYYQGFENWLIDDFTIESKTHITGVKFNFVWNPGYSSNMEKVNVIIVEDLDDCDPDTGPYYYQTQTTEFEEYNTGQFYFSRPEVVVEAIFEGITLKAGRYFIGLMPDGIIDAYGYWLTATQKDCVHFWYSQYHGYGKWTSGSSLGYNYDLSWKIYKSGGVPSIKAYIQPGTEDIESVVMNYGTFPYEDLISYAQIREFITDPVNGTEILTREVGNIDLTPLGGSKALDFGSFTFANEGRYGLFTQIPAYPDDIAKNNEFNWGIGVDDTKPDSWIEEINPPEPDGLNGWYISPVTLTLKAIDPLSNQVSSGVKEIIYTINGGAEQTIAGNTFDLILTEDGNDILIEYWAVDWAGNIETPKNEFIIDGIDQTGPDILLNYEVTSGTPLTGWILTFTATATDATSGMDYVEFYLNDLLQETVTGSGPQFKWRYKYYGGLNLIITAIAYDKAGNYNSDKIENPTKLTNSYFKIIQEIDNQYVLKSVNEIK